MSENKPKIFHKQDKKKDKYKAEVIFRDQHHMMAYLVDKMATNRNKKFNMKLIP